MALSISASSDVWIVDTGETDHIAHPLHLFSTYHNIPPIVVTLPNGSKLLAKVAGTVQLTDKLILNGALFIPEFAFNLLSVSKLTLSGNCCLVFQQYACFIQELTHWKIVGTTKVNNGLYMLVPFNLSRVCIVDSNFGK